MISNDDIGLLIKQIDSNLEKSANQSLKSYDLTVSQMRVLCYLYDHAGERISQKDLEDHFCVAHPTIVGILKRLETKGFITTCTDEQDKRMKLVYPSKQDTDFYHDLLSHQQKTEEVLTQNLTETQVKELRSLLKIVCNSI